MINHDITSYWLRFREIHRCACDRDEFTCRNKTFVNLSDKLSVNLHLMVKDCTIALTFQIEKRMMREVAYRRSVGSCKIIDKELVIRCQCISHGDVKISRESIQSVR